MGHPAKGRATYENLLSVPEGLVGEIVDGTLIANPRPAARHANAASMLGGLVVSPFRMGVGGPGGWVILDEPELHLAADIVVPDLAGWRRERMPVIPDEAFFTLAPDWVCEVLSPSTVAHDRVNKMPLYGRAGVVHLWLVDPIAQTLEIYRRGLDQWVVVANFAGDAKVRAEPFDAVELDLSLLWAR